MKIFSLSMAIFILSGYYVTGQTPLKSRDTSITGPQTFAIIVGISDYKYVRPLSYADKDAEMFRDYLRSPAGGRVKEENIFCLLNEEALCSNFWSKGFQWLRAKQLQKNDRLFFYLAGHGDAIDEDQFFFLGYDCNPAGDKNNYLAGGAIQLFNLKKKIAAETAKGVEVFFIMDACRTSELPGGLPGLNFLNTAVTEKRAGEIIMLATGAGQESLEDPALGNGHGLFTYYLVDGLAGQADSLISPDNQISFEEIQQYVSRHVPAVAEQKFKREQQPYFCCNEYNEKIVGKVDTAYLNNWLRNKKLMHKGPGKSFLGYYPPVKTNPQTDTTLVELYNLFNKTVKENNISGRNSAEYYFEQLDKKFPGSAHTLDARSSLAAAYIRDAQGKINQFITCSGGKTAAEKQAFFNAGINLEKAIAIVKEYDPDYAGTLTGNMHLLKASGNYEKNSPALVLEHAYSAYAFEPDAAYIINRLALLHLENNRADSAVYYARQAVNKAPMWRCGYNTLSLAYQALQQTDSARKYQQQYQAPDPSKPVEIRKSGKKISSRKIQTGITAGGGISQINFTLSNWEQRNINYRDSLFDITSNNGSAFHAGIISQVNFSTSLAWRPSVLLSFEKGEITYHRTPQTGIPGPETVPVETSSVQASLPLIFKLARKNIVPYISAGPSFSFLIKQNEASSGRLPVQSFVMLGEAGLGVDVGLPGAGIILTPEFKFSATFTDTKKEAGNIYTNTLSSLKRRVYSFNLILRRR